MAVAIYKQSFDKMALSIPLHMVYLIIILSFTEKSTWRSENNISIIVFHNAINLVPFNRKPLCVWAELVYLVPIVTAKSAFSAMPHIALFVLQKTMNVSSRKQSLCLKRHATEFLSYGLYG